jgi:thiol-disulfide isomerase/thioredoxin
MTGISTNKYPRYRVKPIGDIFLKYYFTKGENDKCLAILNNLIFNTTNDDLPRDTLSKWYNIVDPTNGSKIYSEALGKASNNYFRTDNNLQVNMPLKWNMILNRIPQEKIKNAKYILVDFWYSGCSPCIAEVPKLNQLNSFLKDNKNIIFISINTDSQSKKDSSYTFETSKKLSINFPVVFDNKLTDFAKQFNVTGYPTKFIINSRGQLITKENGSAMNLSTFYDFIEVNK